MHIKTRLLYIVRYTFALVLVLLAGLVTVASAIAQDQSAQPALKRPLADRVYGQEDFTSFRPQITAATLRYPTDMAQDAQGGVYINDTGNNRVLYMPPHSKTASRVYGQPNFNSADEHTGIGSYFSAPGRDCACARWRVIYQ